MRLALLVYNLPGWESMYCAKVKLADQVLRPVVPPSIVVRDSSSVALEKPGYTGLSMDTEVSAGQRYVTYEGVGLEDPAS